MKQIKQTIWIILTYDKHKLFYFTFGFVFYYNLHIKDLIVDPDGVIIESNLLLLIYFMSFILGLYQASGLSKLKQTYISLVNKNYQKTLFKSVAIISAVFSICLTLIFYLNTSVPILILLISFSCMIFLNLGKSNQYSILRLIIIFFPIVVIYYQDWFQLSFSMISVLMAAHSLLMLSLVFFNKYHNNESKNEVFLNSEDGRQGSSVFIFDDKIRFLFLKLKLFEKGALDLAVISPIGKIGLSSIIMLLIVTSSILVEQKEGQGFIEIITNLIFATYVWITALNSQTLIHQTNTIAHVFKGKDHRQLKNKILFAIDKTIILNGVIYIGVLALIIQQFSPLVDLQYLLISSVAIGCFALAFYPMFLCVEHIHIVRAFPTLLYVAVLIGLNFWLKVHSNIEWIDAFLYIFYCIVLRVTSQYMFWKTSLEDLTNKGIFKGDLN